MTVARFVSAANEVTIGGFWREHAEGELRTRRDHEILKFLSPCWGKEFMAGMYGTAATIFGAFVQEILGMPISLLLALYLVYPRYLFKMGPAYMFSRGVETLRVDGYLALVLLTHWELVSFHRLMEYGEPLSMGKVHSSIETYSYKCAAGLKTLLVQYLMMQNRHMTGEEKNLKSREEWKKMNGGMPLLTDLCLAMRSDPMGIIQGLEEVVTCIYGPAVTYAFPDPLVTTYRYSVTHLSLVSVLDGTALNWCQQELLRAQMSNTVLFGKVKDADLIVCNFRGQMQCRMGGKREGPIETYPKFWNLNPLTAAGKEILRIPAWEESFALVKRELEAIMEKEILPATMPEFPIVRRMTLGMNSPLVVPSIMAKMTTEEMQKYFTDGWDPLFIGYTAAVYFHTSEAKINSWTTQAKKMRGSQPPGYEVRKVLRALEQERLENMLPIWDDGRMIMMEGHVALVDDMKFATRKYRAPYGLEQVEMRQEGKELDAAGQLYVALTEYKRLNPATPSPLSVDTPGDNRSGPVEDRFKRILERRRNESEEESMDETLSEAGEDMEVGNTPEPRPSGEELTTQELLKDLSEENWADTATPPLTPSPRKNVELPLASETSNMGMILLSSEEREKNTFEGNRDMFLGSLKDDAWQEFLKEFNQEVGSETTLDKFKEELWDTVVKFGEPLLIGTGLDEKARKELLNKLIEETTERVRLAPTEDEDLAKLSVVHKLILPQMKESGEKTNNLESAKKMEPGSCLDSTCGSGEHTCDGRSCVRILSFQKEDLVTWFEDITEREKSEVQIVAECYARTTVNIATALGFFSRMCSLHSLERLESEHHLVTALSVESWPGVLQVTQKHIRNWNVGLEAEMGFPMSEAYGLPLNAKSLIGSMMVNLCGSHYPLHMAMVEASNQRKLVDKAFSVPKCVRLARVSHHSHKL